MDCGSDTERRLAERCRDVATKVRNNAAELARRTYHHRQQVEIDLEEYIVLSESASFLAFVELGGDVDRPDDFDWAAQADVMVTKATAHVRRDLQEKGSDSHDVHQRNKFRQDGSLNEMSRWDAWNPRNVEERHDREQVADALSALMPDLERALSTRDVEILVWRYVQGLSQREIGARLGGNVGVGAMSVHRARRRAEEALGDRWRARLRDAILAA